MSASEIPQNMKALSSVADQAQVLAIDALRLSLEIEKAMHSRLWRVLHRIEKLDDASPPRPAAVLDAIALSWQLIDTTHRIRTLADQVRGLSHSTPAYQLFLRNTARTEDFRNFFQHLGTEIPKLPLNTNPIMGVLSWVTRVSSKSRTIVYGTFPKDGNFYSLVLDTQTGTFTTRLQLTAGQMDIDLDGVHGEVKRFRRFFEKWLARNGYLGENELGASVFSFYVQNRQTGGVP